jgi:hypothetical protein
VIIRRVTPSLPKEGEATQGEHPLTAVQSMAFRVKTSGFFCFL